MQENNRRKTISTFIILAIVLLVPGFLYVALNKVGSNTYLKLPVFGEKHLSGKMNRKMGREIPDTVFHQIRTIPLLNLSDQPVELLEKDSLTSVIHIFYGSDEGLSATMIESLRPIVERFKDNHKVKFFSISIDSTDTSTKLANFTEKARKGLTTNWEVLHTKSSILPFVQKDLLMDAMVDPGNPSKYIISNQYILVDSQRRIRGFYDINLKTELDRLEDEIKVQLVEEARNNPLKVEKK